MASAHAVSNHNGKQNTDQPPNPPSEHAEPLETEEAASIALISIDELIGQKNKLTSHIMSDRTFSQAYKEALLKEPSEKLDALILNKLREIENYYRDNADTVGPRADTLQNELKLLDKIHKLNKIVENIEQLRRKEIELEDSTVQILTPRQKPQTSIQKTNSRTVGTFFGDETDDDDELDRQVSAEPTSKPNNRWLSVPISSRQELTGPSTVYAGPAGGKRKTQRKHQKAKKTRKQRKAGKARKNKTMCR